MKLFGIRASLQQAWHIFKKDWKFLLPFTLGSLIVIYILAAMYEAAFSRSALLGIIVYIIYMIGVFAITIANIRVALAAVDGKELHWDLVKSTPSEWLRFIKVSLWKMIYSLKYILMAILPGIIVLIISAFVESEAVVLIGSFLLGIGLILSLVYTSLRYVFATYVMVDRPQITSTRAVVKRSAELVTGSYGRILLLSFAMMLVIIVGMICLIVGVIPAMIVVSLANALVYRKLDAHHAHQAPAQEA